ncbi:Fe-S cluster assembly protein SufD [Fundicoccus culcitae]|uniref:Fe-S cluster assembly protein SufD n=1 Tax=Fundicoccus culcitae TaxID=2969821 RepID=A0ABY5P607_9LACT|nr:Fe-S cluster assembly protein SufD [Fundicoccus culcitae]UUX34152.1 Fe-S cluster assembly protein SufD [Fundicoccus culcitae]
MENKRQAMWLVDIQETAGNLWQNLPLKKIERINYSRWPLFLEKDASHSILGDRLFPDFIELSNQGVIILDLFDASRQYPELIQKYLFSVIPYDSDKNTAYHTAYLDGGVFIYVPKHLKVDIPLENILTKGDIDRPSMNQHLLIVVDENSCVNLIEKTDTQVEHDNSVTLFVELIALAGSIINYHAFDCMSHRTTSYIKRHAMAFKDASINWMIAAMNDGNTILDIETHLEGQGASTQLNVIVIASGKQQQVINSKINNQAKHTVGHILQHGVILDRATLTFNGIEFIAKDAKFADAQQESRVLMLSNEARGDANPILLIDEFEVTAGHAASIGQLDEEQLYYLMSRGLSRKEAEFLVIRGFLGRVITTIKNKDFQTAIIRRIDNKLESIT